MSKRKKLVTWSTLGGDYYTTRTGKINFKMPEFFLNKQIEWDNVHVDEQLTKENCPYDFIMGVDLCTKLGLNIDFESLTVTWMLVNP